MVEGTPPPTGRKFRDQVILFIIKEYSEVSIAPMEDFKVLHGSIAYGGNRRRCSICHSLTSRLCPDCPFSPALCQSIKRDCHGIWHSRTSHARRIQWFQQKTAKATAAQPRSRKKGRKTKGEQRQEKENCSLALGPCTALFWIIICTLLYYFCVFLELLLFGKLLSDCLYYPIV